MSWFSGTVFDMFVCDGLRGSPGGQSGEQTAVALTSGPALGGTYVPQRIWTLDTVQPNPNPMGWIWV